MKRILQLVQAGIPFRFDGESVQICASVNLPTLDKYTGPDFSGFKVRYHYDGDALSDYASDIYVRANSPREAVDRMLKTGIGREAFGDAPAPFASILALKSQFPHSNMPVLN